MTELSLLTLNIANPSPERAERQLGWLAARDEDVLVLIETRTAPAAGYSPMPSALLATTLAIPSPTTATMA